MAQQTPLNESAFHTGIHADLPISSGATTSRVIVNNPLLRTVAFALDEGQELTEHLSPRAVIVQVTQGRLNFTVGGQTRELTAGDVVYLAPNDRHALVALTPARFVLVMVQAG